MDEMQLRDALLKAGYANIVTHGSFLPCVVTASVPGRESCVITIRAASWPEILDICLRIISPSATEKT